MEYVSIGTEDDEKKFIEIPNNLPAEFFMLNESPSILFATNTLCQSKQNKKQNKKQKTKNKK